MSRLRTMLLHSPGLSALAGMIALIAIMWAVPELGAHRTVAVEARSIA